VTFPAPAGTRLRAGALRNALGSIGYTITDQAFQADLYSDVAGLSIELERNTRYAFNGYVAYETGATPDVKFTMAGPAGSVGHWSMFCQEQTATGSIGNLEALRLILINDDSEQQGAAGSGSFSGAMMCLPRGYIVTRGVGGALQVRFAQITTNASATIIKEGSWLRAWRISTVNI
jgi:hypothetical protein